MERDVDKWLKVISFHLRDQLIESGPDRPSPGKFGKVFAGSDMQADSEKRETKDLLIVSLID